MHDEKQLMKLKKLCDAATPGPWEADIDDPGTEAEVWTGKFFCGNGETWAVYDEPGKQQVANARFIAAAREALPHMINTLLVRLEDEL
jgi:hypothetical protein